MRELKAISSSPEVLEKISASKTCGKITGAYERALNFQVSDGTVIGIVETEAGNCPGNIVISSFLGLTSQIDVGTRVSFYPSLLRIGGILAISLQEMSLWNPKIELQGNLCEPSAIREKVLNLLGIKNGLSLEAGTLIANCGQWNKPTGLSFWRDLWGWQLERHLAGLCQGLIEENREKIKNEFSQIIGAGPGLTPSGDDSLVGIFGTLYAILSRLGRYPPALPLWPSLEWVKGTTALGGSLVSHSLRGEIAQRVQNVIIGILTEGGNLEEHLPKLLGMGASSGRDTLMGIFFGHYFGTGDWKAKLKRVNPFNRGQEWIKSNIMRLEEKNLEKMELQN